MTSNVKIRRIFRNANSDKNQYTVQFAQLVETPATSGTNLLVATAQGLNAGSGIVTALFSFAEETCMKFFGTLEADFSDEDFENWPEPTAFEEAAGKTLVISVVENTTKNPNSPKQQPKINPRTNEVLMSGGKPIYRHTELTTVGSEQYVFLAADKAGANVQPKEEVVSSALGAFGEPGAETEQ